MRKHYILILLLGMIAGAGNNLFGQMVGDNVFLQGAFVEIGIAPNGGYGSTLPAPTGYHPNLGSGFSLNFYDPAAGTSTTLTTNLGFVADYGADGWTVGTPPYYGDFYLPGSPQEGWAIQMNGVESDAYIPAYQTFGTTGFTGGLTGTNVGYTNSGGVIKGIWQGTNTVAGGGVLSIRQTTILDTNKLYFTVNVVLTNTGTIPLTNMYYIRTVDPDNSETQNSDYTTINTIADQLPDAGNKVLVSATGLYPYHNAYLGLGTKDCRAKCMVFDGGGLTPIYALDVLYNSPTTTGYLYNQGAVDSEDVGIALDYNIGTLAVGDSTEVTYAYILNATYIDSALNATQPVFNVNLVAHDSVDTINSCAYPYDSVYINIANGGFYNWSWLPDSFLTNTSGVSNVIHSDSVTNFLTYTITGTNAAGGCDSVTFYLTIEHSLYVEPPVPSTTYCQYATPVPLFSPGTGQTWWTTPTGGIGTPVAPTPSTAVAGYTVYYVSKDSGFCQSTRAADTVFVIPLPAMPAIYGLSPYCQGQPFQAFTTADTGIKWYTAPSGGVGSGIAPMVNTGVPGTYFNFASQTVNGCEGPRATIPTVVLDSILPAFTSQLIYGCKADTVLFNNSTTGATHYTWSFGDGTSDTTADPVHIYYTQGAFPITLYALNGNCEDSASGTVTINHSLTDSFSYGPGIVCQNSQPVTFTNHSQGVGLSYTWYFGNGVTDTNTNTTYTYSATGTYNVQLVATDFVPCHDTFSAVVYVDTTSGIGLVTTDTTICLGTYITFTGLYSGIGNTGVSWSFGDGDSVLEANPISHVYASPGIYTATVTAQYRACNDTSALRKITVVAQPEIDLGPDTSICAGGGAITLADNNNKPGNNTSWLWSTGETTSAISITSPGYYYATVTVNNCSASDSVMVLNDCYMSIPNVFTPNGDGTNDYFYPRQFLTRGLTSFKMDIFNRWGQLIFESTSLDGAGWDGKLNNTDQPEGVYIYEIDGVFKDGQKEHHQGNITLLR